VTARLLGYRQPIAHGMWSLSRAVSCLEKAFPLDFPVRVEAAFKLPVYLPARISLGWAEIQGAQNAARAIAFELRDAAGELPHLAGTLRLGVQATVS
jgi:acyl dehydratase